MRFGAGPHGTFFHFIFGYVALKQPSLGEGCFAIHSRHSFLLAACAAGGLASDETEELLGAGVGVAVVAALGVCAFATSKGPQHKSPNRRLAIKTVPKNVIGLHSGRMMLANGLVTVSPAIASILISRSNHGKILNPEGGIPMGRPAIYLEGKARNKGRATSFPSRVRIPVCQTKKQMPRLPRWVISTDSEGAARPEEEWRDPGTASWPMLL